MSYHLSFHTQDIEFKLPDERVISQTVEKLISTEDFTPGEIVVVFMSDDGLLEMNRKFLDHDYYTDIITFNHNEEKIINGELYISVDRVKENAKEFKENFEREIKRVIYHGVLHLVGYNDHTDEEKKEMRAREEFYLNLQSN